MMSVLILTISSLVAAQDACASCFGNSTMTVSQLLSSTKYYDPATGTCGDQKNDLKHNLIFNEDEPTIVPKNWILNPQHCGADPVAIDLAVAEEAWVLSQ